MFTVRMRRKKNLEPRLLECSQVLIRLHPAEKNFEEAKKNKEYLDLPAIFGNNNPVRLEIGSGKGRFVAECALREPDVNFIAVETDANVLLESCRRVIDEKIGNVIFLQVRAEVLSKYIPPHSVEKIYLNFPTPFPRPKNKNRRLTHPVFLEMYRELLTGDGVIEHKTDSALLFEYSIEAFSQTGYLLSDISLNLSALNADWNIMTEYEEKFSKSGLPIYFLRASVR